MYPEKSIDRTLEELRAAGEPTHGSTTAGSERLDRKTRGLVGIGAAVSLGASTSTYRRLVEEAQGGGATAEECIGALMTAAPVAGAARIMTGAPRLATALGYDVGEALE
jgi:alkylhydroperoxidase/carboxymuconolactone decarboxylase family protein YurZ